jgi:hypothetical protein
MFINLLTLIVAVSVCIVRYYYDYTDVLMGCGFMLYYDICVEKLG